MRCSECNGLLNILRQWLHSTIYQCRSCRSQFEWRCVSLVSKKN